MPRSMCRDCARLARLVNGTPACVNGACVIQLLRTDLTPTILGVPSRSPLTLPVFFSVEAPDSRGRTLNLGEAVLLQDEAQTVMRVLRDAGIIVSAFHNHWQFEQPRLMYMHWESISRPEQFLRESMAALDAAGVQTGPLMATADEEG